MGFSMSEDDLAAEDLTFPDKQVVKFVITDYRENAQTGNLILKCQVMSGEHQGKSTDLFISTKDNAPAKKRRAQFFKAFIQSGVWTKADLLDPSKGVELKDILGHVITATSDFRQVKDQVFQNWGDIKDEGIQVGAAADDGNAGAPVSY